MMKTIKHYLDTLDKSNNYLKDDWISTEDFAQEVGLDFYNAEKLEGMIAYYSSLSWICTDTRVGLKFYFFNDELVCLSFQEGRKCDEEFEWVSVEARNKVRAELIKMMVAQLANSATLINWNQDLTKFDEYYIGKGN